MSDLKSLKFTAIPKDNGRNPVFQRRIKLIEQLEHQRKLIDDPGYSRTVVRNTKQDGQRVSVEKTLKVLPWWRVDEKGTVVFFVRHGFKPIEFERGKARELALQEPRLSSPRPTRRLGRVRAADISC